MPTTPRAILNLFVVILFKVNEKVVIATSSSNDYF
jgi:hypothetical protein